MSYKISTPQATWQVGKVKGFSAKELIALENGAFKLVKVNPHSNYPPHVHPDRTEYIYVLKGFPSFLIGDEKYNAKPDDFFIFPHKINHAIFNESDEDCVLMVGAIKVS